MQAEGALQNCGESFKTFGEKAIQVLDSIKAHPVGAIITLILKLKQALEFAAVQFKKFVAEVRALDAEGTKAGNAQAALARKFGLSADAAGGFSLATKSLGLDADSVGGAMIAYQRHLGDAANGNTEAARSFSRLGLDAKQLSKLPVSEQMKQIGDALRGIQNPAERTAAMYSVLTRRGAELGPLIQQGAKALEEWSAKSKRWGLTFSEADAAMIRSATIAQREADTAVASIRQSFANKIAVAFAPLKQAWAEATAGGIDLIEAPLGLLRDGIGAAGAFVKDIVDGVKAGLADWKEPIADAKAEMERAWESLKDALNLSGNWRDTVRGIAREVGRFVAVELVGAIRLLGRIADGFRLQVNVVKEIGGALKTYVVDMLERAAKGILVLLDAAGRLPGRDGRMFRTAAADVRAGLAAAKKGINDLNIPLPQLGGAGADLRDPDAARRLLEAQEATDKLTDSLRAEIATFGMSAAQKERWKLAQVHATQAMLDQVEALQDQVEANKLIASLESPFDKWAKDVGRLNDLLAKGKIDAEQYAELSARATETALKSQREKDRGNPAALAQGSAEARNVILASQRQGEKRDPAEELLAMRKAEESRRAQNAACVRDIWQKVVNQGGNVQVAAIP